MSSDPTFKYAKELQLLAPLFPDWDNQALAFVLADTRGNVEDAALMISDGRASKFTTASRKKEKKPTPAAPSSRTTNNATMDSAGWANASADAGVGSSRGGLRGGRGGGRGGRGGRGGFDAGRGGRGGRGGARGGRGGFRGASHDAPKADSTEGWASSTDAPVAANEVADAVEPVAESKESNKAKASEPAGPAPISWKSIVAGTAKSKPAPAAPASTNAAGLAALEGQINSTTAGESAVATEDASAAPVSTTATAVADHVQNTEEFNASGGWGDAPAASEIDAAAKAVGWDNAPAETPDVAAPAVAKKTSMIPKNAKMSWAQIARPAPKPAPAPKAVPAPPAPPAEAQPEDAQEQPEQTEASTEETTTELAAQAMDQPEVIVDQEPKAPAPVDAVPDAAAVAEVEEEVSTAPSVSESAQTAEAVPEASEPASAEPIKDAWTSDVQAVPQVPAAASAQATSSQAAVPAVSAPAYNGPPGLNPATKASASAPIRTSSRAASRFTDGQAVVMPGAISSSSGLDMQFGSLSFGNASSGPEPIQTTEPLDEHKSSPPAEARQPVASAAQAPVQAQQPAASQQPAVAQPPAQQATQPVAPQIPQSQAQPQQPQQNAFPVQTIYGQSQGGFYQPSQIGGYAQSQLPGQQQGMFPQQYYQQNQHLQQPQSAPSSATPENQNAQPAASINSHEQSTQHQQTQQQQSHQGYYGQHQSAHQDPQSRFAADAQAQHQPQQSLYGGYPQSQYSYGQPQVQQSQSLGNDMYSSEQQRSLYDSYGSGYGRQGQEANKQATPQPASAQAIGVQAQPAQPAQQAPPNQFYSGMNTGYYAPYNPYFQYAPNPSYQQYFPMGQPARAPYQASPAAPAGPMLGQAVNKPASVPQAQSPYAPHQTYPSAGGYDDSSYLNRFNDNKIGQQPAQQAYQAQGGLHNYLGSGSQGSASSGLAPGRAGNDEDIYKNAGSLRGATSLGQQSQQQTSQSQQPQPQSQQPQPQQQQHQQQHSFGYQGYPQQSDWSSYAQYGSRAGAGQYWGGQQ
ncbi:hypothetical protein NliqN6_0827 [Naganishia liquefaciens]|uniref:CUE domain-containing protein n=1 Tax=Naganishia liquefaciens TaxID=104408 RepID=A0A8H3TNQ0_9TREE|nr:hypothetical protein NliqN6_0827 [Naganishia liquefaciens]